MKAVVDTNVLVSGLFLKGPPADILAAWLKGNVLKDAKALEALGLIELVSVKEGNREKFRPKALYDKIVFELEPKKAAVGG